MVYKGTLKSYRLNLMDLEDEDGIVIEMPKGAIYRSMEGKVEKSFEFTYEYGLLWMEIDDAKPLVKRRFKADSRGGMKIELYMEFLGVFTVLIEFDYTKTYHVYELLMDPNDVEMKWEKIDDTHWKLKNYSLYVHGQSFFGDPKLWNVVLEHKNIGSEYWEIIDYCKSKVIPMKIVRYIKKNYKTQNLVKELIEKQDLDLKRFK
jgi:hypothetical protein